MGRRDKSRPTDAELSILQVLWDSGPSTVRQVWDQLDPKHLLAYTTVLKQMQVMQQKGFVSADDRRRASIYTAKITERAARRRGSKHLIKNLFRGSVPELMLQLLADEKPSREELLQIGRAIDEMVRKK